MYRYACQCGTLAQELVESLTEQELAALRKVLETLSRDDWETWKHAYREEIAEYVGATPSQRRRKKSWQGSRKLVLTLAAFQHCVEAQILLEQIDQRFLVPGGPYREMAAKAGLAYQAATLEKPIDWPWSGDSPFGDNDE